MSRMSHPFLRALPGLLLAAGLVASPGSGLVGTASAATDSTGQGIMVTLNVPQGTLSIVNNYLYSYNTTTAKGYFTNNWDGNDPVVSDCSGPGCPGTVAAPGAPSPLSSEVSGTQASSAVQQNQCIFLDGGTLIGHSYTQDVRVTTGSGRTAYTYTYTYTYNVTPTQATVDPLTAWDLVMTTGGDTAAVPVTAQIAGESVLKSANPKLGTKYSFSLLESDGITNRVQNLAVYVDGVLVANPISTVKYPVDFNYATNAGSNGNTSLLKDGDDISILDTDTFAGNDNGGADGSAAALATVDPLQFDLGPGDHTISLTGVVKGNSASTGDISFTVTHTVHIIGEGCSAAP
jgi:hypothetical protein